MSTTTLHKLIWVLIFGGLLTLGLGVSITRQDDTLGWAMVTVGGIAAAVGLLLIVVRSRMKV